MDTIVEGIVPLLGACRRNCSRVVWGIRAEPGSVFPAAFEGYDRRLF